MYFNHKYSRAGHLFQDRFKSEPVRSSSARLLPARLCRLARPRTGRKNDIAYFTTLLRYIHQNRRTKQAQSDARISYALQGGGRRKSPP